MEKKYFQTIVNKKALFDYTVLETIEAGVVLSGPEAKSVRLGQASLADSFVLINPAGLFIHHWVITPYKFARQVDYEPTTPRKLLLHKQEIEHLRGVLTQQKVSLIPLKVFQKKNKFKVELGICRGKKQFEKRDLLKARDIQRDIDREMKDYR
jgi:SsrA-binding protein